MEWNYNKCIINLTPYSDMTSVTILTFLFISLVASKCSTATAAESSSEEEEDTLRMVHLLFRHGDRAPVYHYSNDPWKNESSKIWPEGLGQLTKIGKKMEYQLGLWLRNRYGLFVEDHFVPEEIYVFSTDVDRTLMSAECVLAAFYRPDKADKFREDLLWTPTPVHTAPVGADKLLNVDAACPRIATEFDKVLSFPKVVKYMKEHEELFKFLAFESGMNITTSLDTVLLFDVLFIERLYNLKIPYWAAKSYDELESVTNYFFELYSYTTELQRLRGGPLLKTMAENMKNKTKGLTERKMLMYSGHDSTVSILLNSMGVYNGIRPPYGATVLVELHEINKEYFVKMFYQNDTQNIDPPHRLVLPGCSLKCPLSKWIYLLRDVIPEDWDEECHQGEPLKDQDDTSDSKGNSKRNERTDVQKAILLERTELERVSSF